MGRARPPSGHLGPGDAADQVAGVALARREVLVRVHSHRLRREDLEDAYSQATLELLTGARRGRRLEDATHISNALEQRFLSRVGDRRRALAGRSPMEAALGHALALDDPGGGVAQLADPSPGVCENVTTRMDLARLRETLAELSEDQRLVLACQVADMQCAEFCERFRWTPEKFRKVAQRARARLLELQGEYASGARCRRLEADLAAHAGGVAGAAQARRVERHLANCTACRWRMRELALAEQAALGLAPAWMPACAVELLRSRAIGSAHAPSSVTDNGFARGAAASPGRWRRAAGGTSIATVKLGLIALCVAGVAGGGAALCRASRAHRPRSAPASPPAIVREEDRRACAPVRAAARGRPACDRGSRASRRRRARPSIAGTTPGGCRRRSTATLARPVPSRRRPSAGPRRWWCRRCRRRARSRLDRAYPRRRHGTTTRPPPSGSSGLDGRRSYAEAGPSRDACQARRRGAPCADAGWGRAALEFGLRPSAHGPDPGSRGSAGQANGGGGPGDGTRARSRRVRELGAAPPVREANGAGADTHVAAPTGAGARARRIRDGRERLRRESVPQAPARSGARGA